MWNFVKKKTILVIDDDEVMVLLLKKLFDKKYTVYTASDGVEAIYQLSQGLIPDLVITDIVMENINGYEFIDHLSTSGVYKNIPVIILSGSGKTEFPNHIPFLKVINKPFDPLQLKNLVEAGIYKNHAVSFMQ